LWLKPTAAAMAKWEKICPNLSRLIENTDIYEINPIFISWLKTCTAQIAARSLHKAM